MADVDLAVIGAGPAGLSAAVAAAESGLAVALIDLAEQSGGQFWRHPDERHLAAFARPESTGHHHWATFRDLRSRMREQIEAGLLRHLTGRQVWQVQQTGDEVRPRFEIRTTATHGLDRAPDEDRMIGARRIVLATGAYDRQLPVPGWTLPGVMAAGGVQGMLKSSQVLAGRRIVLAGTGPFLLSVAAGLARAGADVAAVCEANAPTRWLRHPFGALEQPSKLLEGIEYSTVFLRHRIPLRLRTIVSAVQGRDHVESVTTARVDHDGAVIAGTEKQIQADVVAFGWGFTPQIELAVSLGVQTRLDVDDSLVVCVDASQRTTLPGVYAAGETTGVTGAVQAVAEGRLAGLTAAADCDDAAGARPAAKEILRLQSRIRHGTRFAQAMHAASPIPQRWSEWLAPDTIVCRCEEVSCRDLAFGISSLQTDDPRDLRVTMRPGMGWCQGRVCGTAVSRLTAEQTGRSWSPTDLEPLTRRPIAAPLTLGDLARIDDTMSTTREEPA